nr:hypothetical protein Iba_scaffold18403CG0250 [Ipomoea batatas]
MQTPQHTCKQSKIALTNLCKYHVNVANLDLEHVIKIPYLCKAWSSESFPLALNQYLRLHLTLGLAGGSIRITEPNLYWPWNNFTSSYLVPIGPGKTRISHTSFAYLFH